MLYKLVFKVIDVDFENNIWTVQGKIVSGSVMIGQKIYGKDKEIYMVRGFPKKRMENVNTVISLELLHKQDGTEPNLHIGDILKEF